MMAGRRGVLSEGQFPPFRGRPWPEVLHWYLELGWADLSPLVDVVESVIECGGAERLIATTSMHDLWVTRMVDGLPASGVDVVKVAAFTSARRVSKGDVLILHTSNSGQVEEISRPAADAVALFWRFTKEKWGVEPWRRDSMTDAHERVLKLAAVGAPLDEAMKPAYRDKGDCVPRALPFGPRDTEGAVHELLGLGIVQLAVLEVTEPRPLPPEEALAVLGAASEWWERGATPRVYLRLAAAGKQWYSSRTQVTENPTGSEAWGG